MAYLANKQVEEELIDIHNGIHISMENLRNKNYDEAKRILEIVDSKMAMLINNLRPVR